MGEAIRILLLADTHLGFDLPTQTRIRRRRRGHDFLANYARALQPALERRVDLVVHGGDVFNRSRPHASIAYQAFEPLTRAADAGVPVYIVPGNHERGRLPHLRFARHPGIHVFDSPKTFVVNVRGMRIALAGFPSERDAVRASFGDLMKQTDWHAVPADVRFLCLHQCVEGATVGPANYTFTTAPDVIRAQDLPAGFAAILSGHIHRHQVLTHDLRRRPLVAPVLYPGSIERTSVAEADEDKGYLIVDVPHEPQTAPISWTFHQLPARPLLVRELHVEHVEPDDVRHALESLVHEAPSDAVLTIRVIGQINPEVSRLLSAARLRDLAPDTMNIELRLPNRQDSAPSARPSRDATVLELPLL
ncbi:MAG: metallophosphoesterase [Gemmatimonadaceae bacterium]